MHTCFLIPGKPQGKERPRSNSQTGTIYTPRNTKNYEQVVRICYINAYPSVRDRLHEGPVVVEINAYYPIPSRWSKKQRLKALAGVIQPEVKPDWDNVGKIVCDALNGLAWRDDAQIVGAQVWKRYAEKGHVVVSIESGGAIGNG